MENKKFWEQEEWLNKTKETNEVLYNQIKNGKNIDIDFTTFSLVIDGVKHELKLGDSKQEIKVILENGDVNKYIR